jgi:hypothetical protein
MISTQQKKSLMISVSLSKAQIQAQTMQWPQEKGQQAD